MPDVPAQTNILRKKGESIDFKVTGVTDSSGNPIDDLTDYYFWLSVKRKINDGDSDAALRKETGSGFSTLGADAYVSITADESDALTNRFFFWDIWVEEESTEKRWCVAQGTLTLSDSITKIKD